MAPLANHSFACESSARTACSTHMVAFLIDHRTIFRHSGLEITGRSTAGLLQLSPTRLFSSWQNRLGFRLLDWAKRRFIPLDSKKKFRPRALGAPAGRIPARPPFS